MGNRGFGIAGVLLGLAAFAAQAQQFDNRWFATGQAGFALTDDEELDNGGAGFFSVGRGLYRNFAVEGSVQFADLDIKVGAQNRTTDYLRYGVGINALYSFFTRPELDIYLLGGAALRRLEFLGIEQDGLSSQVGLGTAIDLNNNLEFVADARYQTDYVEEEGPIGDTNFYTTQVTFGLRYKIGVWPPPPPDFDGDGVPNDTDRCPNTPYGAEVDFQGCALDSDGDGVPDYRDKCPNTPPGTIVNEDGCPQDSDGDGVMDIADRCPDTPPGQPVDADGCSLDSDGDGVPDSRDLCPGTPYGAEVDINGCPFDTDRDGVPDFRDNCPNTMRGVAVDEFGCDRDLDKDGVFNADDLCPNTPLGVAVDATGCPSDTDKDGVGNDADACPNTYPGLKVDGAGCPLMAQTLILDDVHFEFDRSDLLPDSKTLLRRLIASLKDQPTVRAELSGHTDSKGSDAYNKALSQRRADAVRKFLVDNGIPPENLTAVGYGEERPIAENETDDGRAQNRRVEIELIGQ